MPRRNRHAIDPYRGNRDFANLLGQLQAAWRRRQDEGWGARR